MIVTCRRCGHCYSTFEREPRYAGYFGDEIPSGAYHLHEEYWEKARERVHEQCLARVGSAGKRVLDVGCGLGYFVRHAQEHGAEAYGCELSPAAVRYARERLGLKTVRQGPVEELDYEPDSFDLITLWDVIEHLTDPLPLVTALRGLLRSDGALFVQTPNVEFHLRSARARRWLGLGGPELMEPRDHMNNFSQGTLTALLTRAGFRDVRYEILKPVDSLGLARAVPLVAAKRLYALGAGLLFRVSHKRLLVSNTLHAFARP